LNYFQWRHVTWDEVIFFNFQRKNMTRHEVMWHAT
jgi:hypothetical protein